MSAKSRPLNCCTRPLHPQLLGLILVVCFGSCMDVAAIQQDLPERIDFDHELVTVGRLGGGLFVGG